MAKRSTNGARSNSRATDFGTDFARYDLSEEQRAEIEHTELPDAEVFQAIVEMVAEGYKFSFTLVPDPDRYIVTITAPKDPTTKRRVAVSSWGGHPEFAVRVALFKHSYILRDGGSYSDIPTSQASLNSYG